MRRLSSPVRTFMVPMLHALNEAAVWTVDAVARLIEIWKGNSYLIFYAYDPKTHTHPFNSLFSGTTWVSRYQKGKTNLDFTEARDSEWQWHQLGHMQVCTLLQTDNHASTSPLSFFTGWMLFLPPNQQHQSTEGQLCSIKSKRKSKTICESQISQVLAAVFRSTWVSRLLHDFIPPLVLN